MSTSPNFVHKKVKINLEIKNNDYLCGFYCLKQFIMLDENRIKEQLSLAYVKAVAAIKSFSTEIPHVDNDSIDAEICYNGKLDHDSIINSPSIKLQLKATSNPNIIKDNIHFPLSIKNYNELRLKSNTPRLLVVLCLPELKNDWVTHSIEELILKKCAYFLNLHGQSESTNEYTVTVHIPLSNVFSPDTLYDLMLKTSKEELI